MHWWLRCVATVVKVFKDGSVPTVSFSRQLLAVGQKHFVLEVMVSMCVGCMCINSVLQSSYFAGTIWRQLYRSVVPQALLWKQCHGTWKEQWRNSCLLLLVRDGLIVYTCLVASGFFPSEIGFFLLSVVFSAEHFDRSALNQSLV